MTRIVRLAFALAAALAATACNQTAPPPAAVSAAAPADGARIGVAECDDYLQKYQVCLETRIPENARRNLAQTLERTRETWRKTAATPGGKEALTAVCQRMRDASRASLATYGCSDF